MRRHLTLNQVGHFLNEVIFEELGHYDHVCAWSETLLCCFVKSRSLAPYNACFLLTCAVASVCKKA